ncbi:hypothetical protein BGZ60DRAFT_411288 [Tricladium varicosporioides]|nr:hypothetical protein BGZ60DRAFT_411288 [Hymenoscyphus varicosporioides]
MLDHCQDGTIAEELVDGIILVGGLLLQRDGLVRDFEMSMTKIEAIMEFKNHEKGVYPFRELASLHADIVDYEVPRVFDVSLLKIKEALGLLNEEGTGHLSSIRGVNSQPQNPHPAFSLPSIVIEHEINFIIKPYAASKYASVETQHNALRTLAQIGYAILQARASRQVSKSHDPVFYESIIEDLVTDAMVDIGMGISLMSDDIGTGVLEDIIRLDENRGMAFLYMETVMGMIGLLGDEAREEYIEQEWKLDKNRGNA